MLIAILLTSLAWAVQEPGKRADFIPASVQWLLGHDGLQPTGVVGPAPKAFQERHGAAWTLRRDFALGEPWRLWGSGIAVDGAAMTNDAAAAQVAERFWQDHPELLPERFDMEQLQPWSNTLSAGVRYVSFRQAIDGVPILGGRAFVAIKYGRLVMAGARLFEATANAAAASIETKAARRIARQAMEARGLKAKDTAAELTFLPFDENKRTRLVLAYVVGLDARPQGRWTAYVDAVKGTLLALRDERVFFNGQIALALHERNPAGPSVQRPASLLRLTANSQSLLTDAVGGFSVSGSSADLSLQIQGAYTSIDNEAGAELTASATLENSGAYVWESGEEYGQAQLAAYRFVADVREHAQSFAPDLDWLTDSLTVNVNYDETCNAWFDGELTFLKKGRSPGGGTCNNTAMLADVVYHEFGHGFHYYSIVPGVGDFDEAVSEGLADYMSSSLTGDRYLAPYFMTTGGALRDIEPDKVWPADQNEDPHLTGLIVGGALWDLRKLLISELGETEGARTTDLIFAGAARTTDTVPSLYEAALLADDDDGNLDNGTPHVCAIDLAFGLHGLVANAAGGLSIVHTPPARLDAGAPVRLTARIGAAHPQCGATEAGDVRLVYSTNEGRLWQNKPMALEAADEFAAELSGLAAGQRLLYRIEVGATDEGALIVRPANLAEPYYMVYVGALEPIACDDFETRDNDWTHELLSGEDQEGADDWQWGASGGLGGDPARAYSGSKVWGNDLSPEDNWNGLYQSEKTNTLKSPSYDLSAYDQVRLQFRRWLNVEDASYDKARIYVNDERAWENRPGAGEEHHTDREWVLFDLDISEWAAAQSAVQIRFEIESDQGLEFGGWTIDDFCLYTTTDEPPDGDVPDGDVPDGDAADGDVEDSDGDASDGDVEDGDNDASDGDVDGDMVDGDLSDGDDTPLPDGDFVPADGDIPDGDGSIDGGDLPDGPDDGSDGDDGAPGSGGGGCQTASPATPLLMLGLLVLVAWRRRALKAGVKT
ncbi:MAG: hypothetical protein C4523_19350 [Myxococcales bacterium]|nr:MAG: hypothetical protein C4523_19350 [Myxococcales bacterium]